jgi:hypothetical protein
MNRRHGQVNARNAERVAAMWQLLVLTALCSGLIACSGTWFAQRAAAGRRPARADLVAPVPAFATAQAVRLPTPQPRSHPHSQPQPQLQMNSGETSVDGGYAAREPIPAALNVSLAFGADVVTAGFSGMRPLPSAPGADTPFHWTATPDQVPAQAIAPVYLGAGLHGCLFVDLALAPGVITVSGEPLIRAGLGAQLVNWLGAAARGGNRRICVVVAGAPFDLDYIDVDALRVPALSAFDPHALPAVTEVCFVVCRLAEPGDSAQILALAAQRDRRIIPIVVDDVVGSDWSLFASAPVAVAGQTPIAV